MSSPATARMSTPVRDPAIAKRMVPHVVAVLARSAFWDRRRWSHAVVVLRTEERRVTSRGDFAHWLAANDLHEQAQECTARRVPAGCVLVWLEVDDPGVAVAGFIVLDVVGALAIARGVTP